MVGAECSNSNGITRRLELGQGLQVIPCLVQGHNTATAPSLKVRGLLSTTFRSKNHGMALPMTY
jgi:hypothetical protein